MSCIVQPLSVLHYSLCSSCVLQQPPTAAAAATILRIAYNLGTGQSSYLIQHLQPQQRNSFVRLVSKAAPPLHVAAAFSPAVDTMHTTHLTVESTSSSSSSTVASSPYHCSCTDGSSLDRKQSAPGILPAGPFLLALFSVHVVLTSIPTGCYNVMLSVHMQPHFVTKQQQWCNCCTSGWNNHHSVDVTVVVAVSGPSLCLPCSVACGCGSAFGSCSFAVAFLSGAQLASPGAVAHAGAAADATAVAAGACAGATAVAQAMVTQEAAVERLHGLLRTLLLVPCCYALHPQCNAFLKDQHLSTPSARNLLQNNTATGWLELPALHTDIFNTAYSNTHKIGDALCICSRHKQADRSGHVDAVHSNCQQ